MNAVIIMDDARLDLTVGGIPWEALGTMSERCTATSRVMVNRSAQRHVADRLAARAAALKLGNRLELDFKIERPFGADQVEIDNSAFEAMQDIDTGILYVNAGMPRSEFRLPFNGTETTGIGHREVGTAAIDISSDRQSISVNYSGKLQRAQIDSLANL